MTGEPTAAEWSAALAPNERIIWMGQPIGRGKTSKTDMFLLLFGAFFLCMGLLFLSVGLAVGKDAMFIAIFTGIGATQILVGLGTILLPPLMARRRMQHTRYALTDRRALIYEGHEIRSWLIDPEMQFEIHPGNPGSLVFGKEELPVAINDEPAYRDIGFIAIPDVAQVAGMVRDIQSKQRANTEIAS